MPELTVRSTAAVFGFGLLGATLLGACAHGRLSPAEGDNLRRSVPVGSILELLRRLPVPAAAWSVYFQEGSLRRFGNVDLDRLYCELYLGGAKGEPWEVLPAVFVVVATRSEESEVAARLPGTIAPAALRESSVYETVLVLDSELQPNVRELRCRVEYEAGFVAYPSVGLIHRALDEFFELTLAGTQTTGRAPAVLRCGTRTPAERAGESPAGPRAHR